MTGADAPASPLLIGFSGGGDSRALLQRALETAGGRQIVAGLIDHGLRPDSAAEAAGAAASARAAGARAEVVTLQWPAGAHISQAAARAARMAALTAMARALGAGAIHLAHTMDDQAETVLMRAARGSGWRGMAGMAADAPAPIWPAGRGLRLRRPLLRARRAELRAALADRRIPWIEDPANEAAHFARVRARRLLAAWETHGRGVRRWAGLAARLAPLAAALDRAGRALIGDACVFADGLILLTPGRYAAGAPEIRAAALGALVAAAAGAGAGADWEQLVRLDEALLDGDAKAGTLGGARFFARGEAIAFTRDPGAVTGRTGVPALGPQPLALGKALVWDGRIALTARETGWQAGPSPDGAAPLFLRPRSGARLTLAEALAQGAIQAEWLLQERIAHLLWR